MKYGWVLAIIVAIFHTSVAMCGYGLAWHQLLSMQRVSKIGRVNLQICKLSVMQLAAIVSKRDVYPPRRPRRNCRFLRCSQESGMKVGFAGFGSCWSRLLLDTARFASDILIVPTVIVGNEGVTCEFLATA